MSAQAAMLAAPKRKENTLMIILRVVIILAVGGMFVSFLNPARVSESITKNSSLFTLAASYASIKGNFVRALAKGWVIQKSLSLTYAGALISGLSGLALIGAACISLGENRLRRLACGISAAASCTGIIGTGVLYAAYQSFEKTSDPARVQAVLPIGIWIYFAVYIITLALSILTLIKVPKATSGERFDMHPKYRLMLMILPFIALVFLFSYLPLWGWRYSFFDYKPGFDLSMDDFVGLKWFKYLFSNPATRADIVRVLKNTFAMSGLGILTSWLPMVFAIFLNEIRSTKSKRFVQTFTTIPNFISWVLVYSVAFALFATDGFFNNMLAGIGFSGEAQNHLMSNSHIWLKMWLWGTWKGLGWGAIIYISAISGIDQQLYEAATVDGAGRFKKMWYVTVPSLLPTYFVLLLMSIANILTNGMDQYLAFHNAMNRDKIQVLDLYVYQLGLAGTNTNIPLATLIGMLKSLISVTLLFTANKISGAVRGETII